MLREFETSRISHCGKKGARRTYGALSKSATYRTAAKAGKSVLHLDQAKNYGAAWSSLTLDEILAWAQQHSTSPGETADIAIAAVQPTVDQQLQDALHIPAVQQCRTVPTARRSWAIKRIQHRSGRQGRYCCCIDRPATASLYSAAALAGGLLFV